jgi:hypothetical protein
VTGSHFSRPQGRSGRPWPLPGSAAHGCCSGFRGLGRAEMRTPFASAHAYCSWPTRCVTRVLLRCRAASGRLKVAMLAP